MIEKTDKGKQTEKIERSLQQTWNTIYAVQRIKDLQKREKTYGFLRIINMMYKCRMMCRQHVYFI